MPILLWSIVDSMAYIAQAKQVQIAYEEGDYTTTGRHPLREAVGDKAYTYINMVVTTVGIVDFTVQSARWISSLYNLMTYRNGSIYDDIIDTIGIDKADDIADIKPSKVNTPTLDSDLRVKLDLDGPVVGKGSVTSNKLPKASDLVNSNTVQNHAGDIVKKGINKGEFSRPYTNGIGTNLLLDEIINGSTPVKDSVLDNGLKWATPGRFRGSDGVWELVVDMNTNKIVHFNFTH